MKLIFIRLLCIIITFLSLLVDKNDPVEDLARYARQSTLVAQEIGKKRKKNSISGSKVSTYSRTRARNRRVILH